jgi:hypothetical protein
MQQNKMISYKCNKVGNDKIENCDHEITSGVSKRDLALSSV